ncbi:hypothetical protein ACLVWU_01140 [Bdellovibrio sp. HCB290]|uniref:hypothetical protein n=1 Tax=Bdellovibrio sp. HCB290 TaxID=3394356 RepID=UPI0039B6019A
MKRILIALITVVSFSAFAAPKKEIKETQPYRGVVYFNYELSGKKIRESLHVQKDTIRVNGEEVKKANWKKGEPAMKTLLKLEKSATSKCTAGEYTLKVAKGGKKSQSEKGCVGTPRFKQLEQSFVALKDLLPKQYKKDMTP